jgi:hypothetical protein
MPCIAQGARSPGQKLSEEPFVLRMSHIHQEAGNPSGNASVSNLSPSAILSQILKRGEAGMFLAGAAPALRTFTTAKSKHNAEGTLCVPSAYRLSSYPAVLDNFVHQSAASSDSLAGIYHLHRILIQSGN